MSNVAVARALHSLAAELEWRALALQAEERGLAMVIAALETASEVHFEDFAAVAYTFMAATFGPTRFLIEGGGQRSNAKW